MTDEELLSLAASYAAATRSCDLDTLASLVEPDAVVWHNHDETEVDMDRTNRTVAWLHRTVPDISWEDVSVIPTQEGFVWRAVLTGSAPGGPLRAPTCVVATVSDRGRIARVDEYLDSAALAPLSG